MTEPNATYRIILALTEMENAGAWVTLALNLLPPGGELQLTGLVTISEGVTLSEGATPAQQWRDTFSPFAATHPEIHDEVKVRVDYQPMARVIEDCTTYAANLLLVQWHGREMTGGWSTETLLQQTPCDLVLVHGVFWEKGGPVLLSLRGGPNLTLGFEVARTLAESDSITLFHAADNPHRAPDLDLLTASAPEIGRVVTATGNVERGIARELAGHRAIVLGASFAGPNQLMDYLIHQSETALVVVRAKQQEPITFHAPRRGLFGRRRPTSQPGKPPEELSTRVDRWFAENTFHSNEFSDLTALMTLKEKQGVTISIGLPALNEEETVGKVISILKKTFMDDLPLVDEIVLIDSMSTDNTVAIAESLGVPAHKHPEILPEAGSYRGKGEALWKSLYALKGDIVAWIDTDITNIHPRFIYGILGPLLKRPDIQYVKGFYHRPIKVGDQMQAYGGGRVTELVARPWLNLFYPELSGVVQPLSGEYAGRRKALEQVPFFSGYGVETGLLLDLLDLYGLDGIAQTDLEERVHHNQPLVGLSKMSFAILQVFIMRLDKRYGVQLLDKANRTMKMVAYGPERFALDVAEIGDIERPPINTLAAYQEKFGL